MAISPITEATGNLGFLKSVDNLTQPGATLNPVNTLTPAAQGLAINKPPLANAAPSSTGASALESKSQGQYSNKQFIAPFSYTQNVEGAMMHVDLLGKRIVTSGSMPYRAIISLSAIALPITLINDPSVNNPARLVKDASTGSTDFQGTPTQNVTVQQYGTGINAVVGSLAGRTSSVTSLAQVPTSQLFSSLTSSGPAALAGKLQNAIPFTSINQSIANLPGFSIATNALGQIPGGSSIVSALTNPVGTASNLLQQGLSNSLNLQGGLPSASLGSLGSVFSTASQIANSGPPTSLTGIISLEQQIKGIVCNFKLPYINIPSYDSIVNFKFPKPQDILKQIKKEYDDIKSNIINQLDITKQLKNLLPNPHDIYEKLVTELTTCDKNPNNQSNSKNGQASGPTPPAPSLIANATQSPVQALLTSPTSFKYQAGNNTGTGPLV